MSTTPQMGLVLPVPSTSTPDWGGTLNTAFSLIDTHDHTTGHGILVPSAGIGINADLPFNGFNLTQARTLRLQQQAAAPALAADAGAVYVTTAGDLWYNNGAGQHVQITSGAALSAASLGGISGLGGTSAGVAFNNATKTFTFTQAATQAALLDAGPLVIRDTAASAFGITLQSPVGIAGAYALTLPVALPASSALLSLGATGALTAFGTLSGNDVTLPGNLSLATAASGLVKATATGAQLQLQGNRNAADVTTDVAIAATAARTAGTILTIFNGPQTAFAPVLSVDYQGLVRLLAPAAAIQPASLWTAITPINGWTTPAQGLAYWKDATGVVHMKGTMTFVTGGIAFNFPVGFRPAGIRTFNCPIVGGTSLANMQIQTTGDLQNVNVLVNGNVISFDGVSFLAEA